MTKGRERHVKHFKKKKKKKEKKKRIRAKLMLFMDIVDDDDDDVQLYPAICSILPVQYSR